MKKYPHAFFSAVVWLVFLVYLYFLIRLLVFKGDRILVSLESILSLRRPFTARPISYNLVPMKTILSYLRCRATPNVLMNVLGNMAVFVPLGILLPLMSRRAGTFRGVLLASLALSVLVEFSQFMLAIGSVDIDDVILNTAGGVIGYLMAAMFISMKTHFFPNPSGPPFKE